MPTAVQQLNIMVNDTHVIVTWDAPTDPNGVVSYTVTVSGINLLDNASVLASTTVIVTETEYTIPHTSVPYSEYTAVVVPQTSAGSGPSEMLSTQTVQEGDLLLTFNLCIFKIGVCNECMCFHASLTVYYKVAMLIVLPQVKFKLLRWSQHMQ